MWNLLFSGLFITANADVSYKTIPAQDYTEIYNFFFMTFEQVRELNPNATKAYDTTFKAKLDVKEHLSDTCKAILNDKCTPGLLDTLKESYQNELEYMELFLPIEVESMRERNVQSTALPNLKSVANGRIDVFLDKCGNPSKWKFWKKQLPTAFLTGNSVDARACRFFWEHHLKDPSGKSELGEGVFQRSYDFISNDASVKKILQNSKKESVLTTIFEKASPGLKKFRRAFDSIVTWTSKKSFRDIPFSSNYTKFDQVVPSVKLRQGIIPFVSKKFEIVPHHLIVVLENLESQYKPDGVIKRLKTRGRRAIAIGKGKMTSFKDYIKTKLKRSTVESAPQSAVPADASNGDSPSHNQFSGSEESGADANAE